MPSSSTLKVICAANSAASFSASLLDSPIKQNNCKIRQNAYFTCDLRISKTKGNLKMTFQPKMINADICQVKRSRSL